MKITSVNNDLVKETSKLLQKKYRDESGLFLLEGKKCIEEAIHSKLDIERLFILEGEAGFNNIECIETTEAVLSKISSTSTPPKMVGVAKQAVYKWSKQYRNVVLLENIQDAGNLGTILRSACAFDVDAIILYGNTVDLYNPKCIRSSVGNLWKIPVFEIKNIAELNSFLELHKDYFNPEIIATLPKSDNTVWLSDYNPAKQYLIMFGTESIGLSEELKQLAVRNITIEMSNKVESLNLSISAGIILYKLFNLQK